MEHKIWKILAVLLAILLAGTASAAQLMQQERAAQEETAVSDIEKDVDRTAVFGRSRMLGTNETVNHHRMVANLVSSGICGEKTEAVAMIAQMLFDEGKEAEFIAGVCGNILCEGRIGMFERDWGGGTQKYLPSRMSGDPYKYNSRYGNRCIYDGYSLSKVYKMAKDLYYSYNWNTGKYMFGLGCVQWTQKRVVQLVEYYIAEADGSDTITKEQCMAAEMKFIKYELNTTETGAYEHWLAGDHKKLYQDEAARAGYCVAKYYERCNSKYYSTRAQTAVDVYEAMLGKGQGTYAAGNGPAVEK